MSSGKPPHNPRAIAPSLADLAKAGITSSVLTSANSLPRPPAFRRGVAPASDQALIPNAAALGRHVRAARESMDKSQQELAALSGVGRRFVSELENGKPTLEIGKVFAVLNACGIDLFAKAR